MPDPAHIHPVFHRMLDRTAKEALLGQRGVCIWMTGLSGSGKSTIAIGLERRLHDEGRFAIVLDGDNLRTGLNHDLGFSEADRAENIRRVAETAKLFVRNGVIVICTFVSPTKSIRDQARAILGAADFTEVFIDTPIELCEQRDVKGLYAKARAGEVKDFTGISAPFEAPERPDVRIATAGRSEEQSTDQLHRSIARRITRT